MLYIDSKKVDELIDEHKVYLEKKIPWHCEKKTKEIKSFSNFFNKYCGNSDIDSISNKLIEVCLRSDLESVKNEFNTAFSNTFDMDFLSELKKSKNEQLKEAKEMATLLNKLLSYAGFNKGTKEWNRHI